MCSFYGGAPEREVDALNKRASGPAGWAGWLVLLVVAAVARGGFANLASVSD